MFWASPLLRGMTWLLSSSEAISESLFLAGLCRRCWIFLLIHADRKFLLCMWVWFCWLLFCGLKNRVFLYPIARWISHQRAHCDMRIICKLSYRFNLIYTRWKHHHSMCELRRGEEIPCFISYLEIHFLKGQIQEWNHGGEVLKICINSIIKWADHWWTKKKNGWDSTWENDLQSIIMTILQLDSNDVILHSRGIFGRLYFYVRNYSMITFFIIWIFIYLCTLAFFPEKKLIHKIFHFVRSHL